MASASRPPSSPSSTSTSTLNRSSIRKGSGSSSPFVRNEVNAPASSSSRASIESSLKKAANVGVNADSTPTLSSPLHLHPSVQSHLATELSFLHTLMRRARDQHRLQLFLRRMYDVLRLGRSLVGFIRAASPSSSQRGGDDKAGGNVGMNADMGVDVIAGVDRWKSRGQTLVSRVVKSLYTAHRFTSQIIELHHFLPLQTSVLSIYARLFVLTINVANALNMNIEHLIAYGGGQNAANKKKKHGDSNERKPPYDTVSGQRNQAHGRGLGSVFTAGHPEDNELYLGSELGERIERTRLPAPSSSYQTTKSASIAIPSACQRTRKISAQPSLTLDEDVEMNDDRDHNHIHQPPSSSSFKLNSPVSTSNTPGSNKAALETRGRVLQDDTASTLKTKTASGSDVGRTDMTKMVIKKRSTSEAEDGDDAQDHGHDLVQDDNLDMGGIDTDAPDRTKVTIVNRVEETIKEKENTRAKDRVGKIGTPDDDVEKTKLRKKKKLKLKQKKKDDMDDIFGF
ncbi:hypothetical protein I317_07426 [Kwoniella heveanensis CBS 569]|nr:hypothetical protein I317_07426 [Kwoniella heveanensis CBS 569]